MSRTVKFQSLVMDGSARIGTGACYLRLSAVLLWVLLWVLIALPMSVMATALVESPWRNDAAAHRVTSFYCALAPIPWDEIDLAWSQPPVARDSGPSAYELLATWPQSAALVPSIRQAIDTRNKQALYENSTRAIARALLAALDAADRDIRQSRSASAMLNLTQAREYYRVFEDAIRSADPDAFRQLGLAWLELNSSTGSAGLLGAGEVKPQREKFDHARQALSVYISNNYDPDSFAPRAHCEPLPEQKLSSAPLSEAKATLPPGSFIQNQSPLPQLVLNFENRGIDETELPLVAYGDMLFDSPRIFGEPARGLGISCASCHNRGDVNQAFFIPGISHQPGAVDVDSAFFNPLANDLRDDSLDIPSLRGLRFTGPYGRDGRFASLRDFTRNVIVQEFAGEEPTPFMLDALLAYMREFDFLPNSRLTADGELSDTTDQSLLRGQSLFRQPFAGMGDRSCASCHIPDSNFLDRKSHDIGTVTPAYQGARSGALDTPGLLGSLYTAPYFHDGSVASLGGVVEWFDQRFALELSDQDKTDLTAYLELVGSADEPYQHFDDSNTQFRLFFDELMTFASTLDTLIPRQDRKHSLLLIDTVATDLRLDASVMQNLDARQDIYHLSAALAGIGEAVAGDDWSMADSRWQEFKGLLASVDHRAY